MQLTRDAGQVGDIAFVGVDGYGYDSGFGTGVQGQGSWVMGHGWVDLNKRSTS